MTQEQKARAYDEALEKQKNAILMDYRYTSQLRCS